MQWEMQKRYSDLMLVATKSICESGCSEEAAMLLKNRVNHYVSSPLNSSWNATYRIKGSNGLVFCFVKKIQIQLELSRHTQHLVKWNTVSSFSHSMSCNDFPSKKIHDQQEVVQGWKWPKNAMYIDKDAVQLSQVVVKAVDKILQWIPLQTCIVHS